MLPNGGSTGAHQRTTHHGVSVGPGDYPMTDASANSGYHRRQPGGSPAEYHHAREHGGADDGGYGGGSPYYSPPGDSSVVSMRQNSASVPMEPRVAIDLHHDYDEPLEFSMSVTNTMKISRNSKHKPMLLHFTRKQLQVAADDKLNVVYPRGIPNDFGHIDMVDTWRLSTFKFSSILVLLNGRLCEMPLKITSRTQRFLNDLVDSDLSRTCAVITGGKHFTPAYTRQIDTEQNRDKDLLNLIGAYKSEEELWRTEVRKANQGRNRVWYGSSEHNPEMVAVNPVGLIHAATARVLGEEKCHNITQYPLDPSGYRTLLLRDAQCGMKWLCDHLFRMCLPQRLDKGMMFSVAPFNAASKAAHKAESGDDAPTSPDDSSSDEEHDSDSDEEIVYDDADLFNMYPHSDESGRAAHEKADWREWLDALGDDAGDKTYTLQVTAVVRVTMRMCVHKKSPGGEPRMYCL